jgi:hypothetical protein
MEQEWKMERNIKIEIATKQRKIKKLKIISVIVYMGVLIIPLGFRIFNRTDYENTHILGFLAVACLPCGYLIGKYAENKNKELKELIGCNIVKEILTERVQIIDYMPNGYINEAFVKDCSILPNFNVISGSDYINGIYRNLNFTFCDLELLSEYRDINPDSNYSLNTVTEFKGTLITMNIRQNIQGFVVLKEKMRSNWGENKGYFNKSLSRNDSKNTLRTGNEIFDSRFDVVASDDKLAFAILTPAVINAIMKMEGEVNIQFSNNMIVIALNNGKNFFELGDINKDENKIENHRQKFRDDLSYILRILDYMIEGCYFLF